MLKSYRSFFFVNNHLLLSDFYPMKKNKNFLVWQFYAPTPDSELLPTISYIIGTMHIRDERAFQFEQIFLQKITACEVFATEFDLDDTQVVSVTQALMLPLGISLQSLMPPKLYKRINDVVKKQTGMDLMPFNFMKPIAVTNFLSEFVLSKDRMLSLDETLWQFAKEQRKILRGIETFNEQLDILEKMSIDDQIKGLKDVVRNFPKFRKQLLNMTKLYEKADIAQLYKVAKQTAKGGRKILLYDRNTLMADRIAEFSEQNTICVAIGAGHLAGKKGVLHLLKQKGFVVKPA